ncbi:hypothetical protein [Methylobacterium sp. A54F]
MLQIIPPRLRPSRPGAALASGALVLGLLVAAGPAAADAVPQLDIEKTCKSAARAEVSVSVSDNASVDGCLRSERDAKRQAEQNWGKFPADAKRQCEAQFKAGGYPSYVEMITCLELASGTVPTQPQGGSATGGPGAPKGGADARPKEGAASNLTQEPAAAQRTNPIEVLEKQ